MKHKITGSSAKSLCDHAVSETCILLIKLGAPFRKTLWSRPVIETGAGAVLAGLAN